MAAYDYYDTTRVEEENDEDIYLSSDEEEEPQRKRDLLDTVMYDSNISINPDNTITWNAQAFRNFSWTPDYYEPNASWAVTLQLSLRVFKCMKQRGWTVISRISEGGYNVVYEVEDASGMKAAAIIFSNNVYCEDYPSSIRKVLKVWEAQKAFTRSLDASANMHIRANMHSRSHDAHANMHTRSHDASANMHTRSRGANTVSGQTDNATLSTEYTVEIYDIFRCNVAITEDLSFCPTINHTYVTIERKIDRSMHSVLWSVFNWNKNVKLITNGYNDEELNIHTQIENDILPLIRKKGFGKYVHEWTHVHSLINDVVPMILEINNIVIELARTGWIHNDIHLGNWGMVDGKIILIDLDSLMYTSDRRVFQNEPIKINAQDYKHLYDASVWKKFHIMEHASMDELDNYTDEEWEQHRTMSEDVDDYEEQLGSRLVDLQLDYKQMRKLKLVFWNIADIIDTENDPFKWWALIAAIVYTHVQTYIPNTTTMEQGNYLAHISRDLWPSTWRMWKHVASKTPTQRFYVPEVSQLEIMYRNFETEAEAIPASDRDAWLIYVSHAIYDVSRTKANARLRATSKMFIARYTDARLVETESEHSGRMTRRPTKHSTKPRKRRARRNAIITTPQRKRKRAIKEKTKRTPA